MAEKTPPRLLNSWAYQKAKHAVNATLGSPAKLLELVSNARILNVLGNNERFSDIVEPVKTAFRLLKRYAKGDYRDISKESLALLATSVIYFVMPIDLIPDFLLGLGFLDDISLLAWTVNALSQDLDRFTEWEKAQAEESDPEPLLLPGPAKD
ncbi:hypothetical protein GCM10008090_31270 [Arenicella chitinivorans]|uniref:DUF1232 domain-containing protein n=1 Tax=Arenicella chitinivorans TaxID=1329800 RepID=A0A918VS22_9GAMM|nr:YkvA family protein [Arenicella chitinivorans]GHA19219.1 hypothetical protein GCM10008090_31270 [Arenicella chitinivorans]